jgi:hypothetical protein
MATETAAGPRNSAEAAQMLETAMQYLAGAARQLTETEIAGALKALERADAAGAAARGQLIRMFEILGGPRGDG